MKSNLLATKFHQPAPPPKRVLRPQLLESLNEGLALGSQVTLVSAPAGFGKTICISEWVSSLNLPAAWLALDPGDNDPGRFMTYFVAALQKVDPNLGWEIEGVLRSGQLPPKEAITAALINDILGVDGKFILILDDFQVIQEKFILDVLEQLIANQPEPIHLVLITREDPLLPLARLRAHHQLTEVRASDLRFSSSEADCFLNGMMGLSLSEADVAALENRTEGWIVGLQLAGLSMRGRSDPSNFIANLSGNHRYILSYLTEEVLGRQSQEIQNFLLQTSILDKLNGDVCDAVTKRTDSSALLERLFNANLFLIPLDDNQQWYRYHHLFADLLRNQQMRIQKDQATQLHQRASQWYDQAGMVPEAIEHALATADYPHAVQLLEQHASGMVNQGYVKTVEGWMQAIPVVWHSQSPKANLAFAWMHVLRGSYHQVLTYLKLADEGIKRLESAAGGADATTTARNAEILRAEWYALQSGLYSVQGNGADGITLANRALQMAHADDYHIKGLAYFRLGGAYRDAGDEARSADAYQKAIQNSRAVGSQVPEMLAVAQLALLSFQNGQLRFAADLCGQAIDHMEQSGQTPPISAPVYAALGSIHYEWNHLEQAQDYLNRAAQLSSLGGHNAAAIVIKVYIARLAQARGDLNAAAKNLQEASDLLQLGAPAWVKPELAAQLVRLYLAQNNPAAAEAALKQGAISTPDAATSFSYPNAPYYLAHLRLIIYTTQDLTNGIILANQLIANAEQKQHMAVVLQARLLRAQLNTALGNPNASLDDIDRAVALAEPEGYIRAFVDEGTAITASIAALPHNHPEWATQPGRGRLDFVNKLLTAFPVTPAAADRPLAYVEAGVQPHTLVEPLSARELDVLRLIAEGLKYEEIAEKLIISLNTVRFHVKEIYSKLNVNNRTRAIDAARQMQLL